MAEELNKQLQNELHKELLDAAKEAKSIGYNPTKFNQMIATEGGYVVAKKLIHKTSSGFEKLWELNRLDLSTEAVILQKKYRTLFTEEELEIAKTRLNEFGYSFDGDVIDTDLDVNYKRFITSLKKREYIYGMNPETRFHIVIFKQAIGQYLILLLDKHIDVYQGISDGLTKAKNTAFEKLLSIDSNVFIENKVTTMHYKSDRPNGKPWVKDTAIELDKNVNAYYRYKGLNVNSKSAENEAVLPALVKSNRKREFDSYSEESKSEVLFEYLTNGLSPRELEDSVLKIDSSVFKGFQVINILHYLGVNSDYKGYFQNKTIDVIIDSFQDLGEEADMIVNLLNVYKESEELYKVILNDTEAFEVENDYALEGGKKIYLVSKYERNPKNRQKAIEIHGLNCRGCGFNFEKVYGDSGKDFIEIHHIKPLSALKEAIKINPETDLIPLCANCHRMVHRRVDDVLSIEELRKLINSKK